jgi:hypothetical protein
MTAHHRTCATCGATLNQRALYLTEDYGYGSVWQCRSLRQCAKRHARTI